MMNKNDDENKLLIKAKRIINNRVQSSYIPDEFVGGENEKQILKAILDDAILNKKSSVALITGPKGSGKSCFFKNCLKKYDESIYKIVKLSGMIHFNDNFALKEIATVLDIDIPRGISIFDTFELIRNSLGKETLETQINTSTKKVKYQRLPIIILIEELELMLTSSATSKQNLFYNLLDLAHYKNVSLSFIATTSHHDIVEMFEKRIKSRFTQESIKIPSITFDNMQIIFKNILSLPESFESEQFKNKWNKQIELTLKSPSTIDQFKYYYKLFNRVPYYNNLVIEILNCLGSGVGDSDDGELFITNKIINDSFNKINSDSLEVLLCDLTVLEFTILGCILNTRTVNEYITFNELYDGEYKKFSKSFFKNSDQANKSTTIRILQHLLLLNIIKQQSRLESGEFIKFKLSIDPETIISSAKKRKDLPTSLSKYIIDWLS